MRMVHGLGFKGRFMKLPKKNSQGEKLGVIIGKEWRVVDILNKVEINKRGRKKQLSGSKTSTSEMLSHSNPLSCNRLKKAASDPQEKRQLLKKGSIQLGPSDFRNRL